MAILIIDDEENTREALRAVLTQIGHKSILEARNGEEALKVIDTEKTRIEMIIADWEMPYMNGSTLSDRILDRTELDGVPFLLITSDLSKSQLLEFKSTHPRIDHFMVKPFRARLLSEALQEAYANRIAHRNALLWLGSTVPAQSLLDAVRVTSKDILFREVITDPSLKHFGAVFIDLQDQLKPGELSLLRKSRAGASVPWICLSRDPKKLTPFRSICNYFIDFSSLNHTEGWQNLLATLTHRLLHGIEIDQLSHDLKTMIQQKKAEAKPLALKLLKLDSLNTEANIWLADLLSLEGDLQAAIQYERAALALNPCLARPYIKLLELLLKHDQQSVLETASLARMYCPQNVDVLLAAASALNFIGQATPAREIALEILRINPQHEVAQKLAETETIASGKTSEKK